MNKNIIFIDGHCMICNSFALFVHKKDIKNIFYFSTLQGDLLQILKKKADNSDAFNPSFPKTVILYYNGILYYKSSAVLKILSQLSTPWSYLPFFMNFIPVFARDFVYDVISKLRYMLFGKQSSCSLPEQSFKDRIL